MPSSDIPYIVRHCALAIYLDGYGAGSKEQKFWLCFDVARWRLVEYGYLRKGSQYGPPSNIVLTSKGKQRETYHKNETGAADKNDKFHKLYSLIETAVETLPMNRKARNLTAAQARTKYKHRLQERKAEHASKLPPYQKRTTAKKAKKATAKRVKTRRVRRRT